ncbi:RasGEF domain-containing protein [Legionella waltersii]|uniref:RasGEF domain protein n=1 Tax=Legionella waltersii TaxID=66969 RepID=A0A0W1A2M3_9GAMM|nr:RasGEF domain-containing protein [Legionella waltersii]KTD75628.1 RasGEF domain protein [Legionella waltersii]SNU98994.1 RasGEF domain [Legionella waltersii]
MLERVQELIKMMSWARSLNDKLFVLEDDLRRNGPTHEWFCVLDELMLNPDFRKEKKFIALYEDGIHVLSQLLMELFRQKFIHIENPITKEQEELINSLSSLVKKIEMLEQDKVNTANKQKIIGYQAKILHRLVNYCMVYIDPPIEEVLIRKKETAPSQAAMIDALLAMILIIKNQSLFDLELCIAQLPMNILPEVMIDELSKLVLAPFEENDFIYQRTEYVIDKKTELSTSITVKKTSREQYDHFFDWVSRFVAADILIKNNLNLSVALIAINRWIMIANTHLEHHDFGGFKAIYSAFSKPAVIRLIGTRNLATGDELRENLTDETRELLSKLDIASRTNQVHNPALKSVIDGIDHGDVDSRGDFLFIPAIDTIVQAIAKVDGVASLRMAGNLYKLICLGKILSDMQKIQGLDGRGMPLPVDMKDFVGDSLAQMKELDDDEMHYKLTMSFSYQLKKKSRSNSISPEEIQEVKAAKTAQQEWTKARQNRSKLKNYAPSQLQVHVAIRDKLKVLDTTQPLSRKNNEKKLETSIARNLNSLITKLDMEVLDILMYLQANEHRRIYKHSLTSAQREQLLKARKKMHSFMDDNEPIPPALKITQSASLEFVDDNPGGEDDQNPISRIPSNLSTTDNVSNSSMSLITGDTAGFQQPIKQYQDDLDGIIIQEVSNDLLSVAPAQLEDVNSSDMSKEGNRLSLPFPNTIDHAADGQGELQSTTALLSTLSNSRLHYTKNHEFRAGAKRFFELAAKKSQKKMGDNDPVELALMSKLDPIARGAIEEFFQSEQKFHQIIQQFVEVIDEHMLPNSEFSEKVQFTLTYLLAPYRLCIHNPFLVVDTSGSLEAELLSKLNIIKSTLNNNKYFRSMLKGIEFCTINYDLLNQLIREKKPIWSKSLNKTSSIFSSIDRKLMESQLRSNRPAFKLADAHIVPTQRLMRIKLLLVQILGEPKMERGVLIYKNGLNGLLRRLKNELDTITESEEGPDLTTKKQYVLAEIKACGGLCDEFNEVMNFIDYEISRINQTKDVYKHSFEINHVIDFIIKFEKCNSNDIELLNDLKRSIETIRDRRLAEELSVNSTMGYHQANIRYLKEMNLVLQGQKWHFQNKSIFDKLVYLQESIYSTLGKIELSLVIKIEELRAPNPQPVNQPNNNNNNRNALITPAGTSTQHNPERFFSLSDEVEFNRVAQLRRELGDRSQVAIEYPFPKP